MRDDATLTCAPARRLRRAPQWLRNRLSLGGLILVYHRIAEAAIDPFGLCTTPAQFAEHLDIVSRRARPTRLDDLVRASLSGRVPDRAVALTFDDGYADNSSAALPLLERYGVPATLFVATHAADPRFWWDMLARLLLSPDGRETKLGLDIGGSRRVWTWSSPAERDRAFWSIYGTIQALPSAAQRNAITDIADAVGGSLEGAGDDCVLTREEIRRVAASRLFDIGAHTMTHPVLPLLTRAQQHEEIVGSKLWLEEVVGRPIRAFAYPYGKFSSVSVEEVARAGFSHASSCVPDFVWHRVDPFRLPRVTVGAWDGERFAALARWLR